MTGPAHDLSEATENSVRVVTGASSGIGASTARALAQPGTHLILHGRNRAALDGVAADVRAAGADATVLTADLTDPRRIRAFAAELPDRIDVLVHSAGIAPLGTIGELKANELDLTLRLNVLAPALLTRDLLPRLRAAGGLVVFINSGSGLRARAGWGGYAASKHALRAIADALREEEADHGVRVTTVYPGRTATPMQRAVRAQEGGAYTPGDYLDPDEVAQVVADVVRMPRRATVPDVTVRPG